METHVLSLSSALDLELAELSSHDVNDTIGYMYT